MDPILTPLSPRQHECLRLAWERLTSKEIALRLHLSPRTVDGYIAEAIETLGAVDRREAARMVFGAAPPATAGAAGGAAARPRNDYGGDPARVATIDLAGHQEPASTGRVGNLAGSDLEDDEPAGIASPARQRPAAPTPSGLGRPLASKGHPRNELTPTATILWIGIITIASLVMLALVTSIGFGLASIVVDWRGGHHRVQ